MLPTVLVAYFTLCNPTEKGRDFCYLLPYPQHLDQCLTYGWYSAHLCNKLSCACEHKKKYGEHLTAALLITRDK